MYELILIIIFLLFILYLLYDLSKIVVYDYFYYPKYVNYNDYTNYEQPFWNSTRHTRGMSYDLRGDVPIPYFMNLPFNITERVPIQNKTLNEIS